MSRDPMDGGELPSSGMSGTGILIAFLAGAAVGAVAALLTTPKTGPEMRATLRDWAKSFGDGEGRDRPTGADDRPDGT